MLAPNDALLEDEDNDSEGEVEEVDEDSRDDDESLGLGMGAPVEKGDENELEAELTQLLSGDGDANDGGRTVDLADVLLKLSLMCDEEGVDVDAADAMNNVYCRMATSVDGVSDLVVEEDAPVLRAMLRSATAVLKRALDVGDEQVVLDMTKVSLLRTACFALTDTRPQHEYVQHQSRDGRLSELALILRHPSVSRDQLDTYATGEAMDDNFRQGLLELERLTEQSDAELGSMLTLTAPYLAQTLTSMVVPLLFDGKRLNQGNEIAAHIFGDGAADAFGRGRIADHALNASASIVGLARIERSFCALMVMARMQINHERACERALLRATAPLADDQRQSVEEHVATLDRIFESTTWLIADVREAITSKANTSNGRRDAPGSVAAVTDIIASWYDLRVAKEDEQYAILVAALRSPVLTIGASAPQYMRDAWGAFVQTNGTENVCVWGAVGFLSMLRVERQKKCMSVSTAFLVVLSGVAGSLMSTAVRGPFVLCADAVAAVRRIFHLEQLPRVKHTAAPRPPARASSCSGGAGKKRKRDGRPCKQTKIILDLLDKGAVRRQNKKSQLAEVRLAACLFMLSLKESLQRCLPEGACASPSEGRKDLRRLYIKFLQMMPSEKHPYNRRENNSSYLVERSRSKEDDGRTTRDNVEKPWRDVQGGALLGTMYYPLAGSAFLSTLEAITVDGAFASTTDVCVHKFVNMLSANAALWFAASIIPPPERRVVGRERAVSIFAQQSAVVAAMCHTVDHVGCLWEHLQLTHSMHNSEGNDVAEDDWEEPFVALPLHGESEHTTFAPGSPTSPSISLLA